MVKIVLKQVVAWTGNLKETGDIEIVFIKIAVSDRRKSYFLGRPHDLQADLDFYVVLQR